MEQKEIQQLQQLVESAYLSLKAAMAMFAPSSDSAFLHKPSSKPVYPASIEASDGSIVQGYFDGQQMIGDDGKKYSVPANYASKSKLVEGDRLKLTIKHDGRFVFKQIAPVERKRLKGVLFHDEMTDQYRVVAEERSYRVLTASVTYFKGQPGDEVILLVPKDRPSLWGAVEHMIHSLPQPSSNQPTQPSSQTTELESRARESEHAPQEVSSSEQQEDSLLSTLEF